MFNIEENIEKYGYSVIATSTHEGIPFAYTIGLSELDIRELVIVGLPPNTAHMIIANAVGNIMDRNEYQDEEIISDLCNLTIKASHLHTSEKPASQCFQAIYRNENSLFTQLLYPDKNGMFSNEILDFQAMNVVE